MQGGLFGVVLTVGLLSHFLDGVSFGVSIHLQGSEFKGPSEIYRSAEKAWGE